MLCISISPAAAISGVEGVQLDMVVDLCTSECEKDYGVAGFILILIGGKLCSFWTKGLIPT
jgi:hypothetical protein